MKKTALLLLYIFPFLFTGCKKPPIACMELSTAATTTNTAIEFTSCSEHAISYEWFIAGPAAAPENKQGWSDQIFSHAFTEPGSYTVTLNVYSDFSFTGEKATTQEKFIIN